MSSDQNALRDWHRLFGLLLTDYFTNTPFTVEIERDLSLQQQFLDIVIVRRHPGKLRMRLPDGLHPLALYNLITFKSHREALDAWALKELIGHYVAYRKFVSPSTDTLLPEESFRLFAVCARFPQSLVRQVPFHEQQAGVYNCRWGTDQVRVIVAGELPQQVHNAPLHLFSASKNLVGFGSVAYQQKSEATSPVIEQLFAWFRAEGFAMYTMEDFKRDYFREHFPKLPRTEQRRIFESLPPEELREIVASLPAVQLLALRKQLEQLTEGRTNPTRKSGRKKR